MLFAPFSGIVKPVIAADNSDENAKAEAMTFALVVTGVIVGLMALFGVITASDTEKEEKAYKDQLEAFAQKFNARVGQWSYDDMLMEFGNPSEVTEGDKVKIVLYDNRKSSEITSTEYQSATFLSRASSQAYSTKVTSGEVLAFSFDKKTKTMLKWRYRNYSAHTLVDDITGPK